MLITTILISIIAGILISSQINMNTIISPSLSFQTSQSILITLTLLLTIVVIITTSYNNSNLHINYLTLYLIIGSSLLILFSTNNIISFFILFETTIIPIFLLIILWGNNPERIQASFYIIIYTITASLPFLASIFFLSSEAYSNSLVKNENIVSIIWLPLMLIFLINIPAFLLHTWLPKAHVEAPVTGSIILAGVLLNIGSYGLLNFNVFLMGSNSNWSNKLIALSVAGGLTVSLNCLRQTDLNIIIAFSSVAHISGIISALSILSNTSINGALLLIIAHGLCSSALFFLMNLIYINTQSRNSQLIKGSANTLASISIGWFIACCLNIAAPPSINFTSEIIINSSLISTNEILIYATIIINILVGTYCILMFCLTCHGQINTSNENLNSPLSDLITQAALLAPLLAVFFNSDILI